MGNEPTSDTAASGTETNEPSFNAYPIQKQSSIKQKLLKIKQMSPTKYIASPRWSCSNTKSNNLTLQTPSFQFSLNHSHDKYPSSDSDTSMTTPVTPSFSINDSYGIKQNSRTNKLTQRVISDKMAEIAATFWCNNIESASVKQRLVELPANSFIIFTK